MMELKAWMELPRKEKERVHHISGSEFEPLPKLSHVIQPNTNRNQTLMEHWNQTVAPEDTVYVDGMSMSHEGRPRKQSRT